MTAARSRDETLTPTPPAGRSPHAGTEAVHPYKLASLLLQYPTEALFAGIGHLEAAAAAVSPRSSARSFGRFVGWLAATAPGEVAQHYVATFDLRRRCSLYLTYHRYGDTRKRGMSLLTFKAAYRAAGFGPPEDELPDYLPVVLEFAALSPRGGTLLRGHRADLEMLRRSLHDAGTPYAELVDAVAATLPRLGRKDLALVRQAFESGPPAEEVGLEPFAPPQYLSGESLSREGGASSDG